MFLKEIKLTNYKCFEADTFLFKKRFTTIIGDNGSGKTALLDGIAAILMNFTNVFHKSGFYSIEERDYRVVSHQLGSKIGLEKQSPNEIEALFLKDNKTNLNIFISDSGGNTSELNKYVSDLSREASNGKNNILPIIAYYKTSRHWSTNKHEEIKLYDNKSRLETYKTALNPETSFKTLHEWLMRMELIQFQRRKKIPELDAVLSAMRQSLKGLIPNNEENIEVYFSAETSELMVNIGDKQELPIRMLSDGYRNTLGMIADISYRMAELNPHVGNETPGIVLIDELDLHLHPKWQRKIVNDLKEIFPNCQFIVTTHSPFIIQSLEEGELLKLERADVVETGNHVNQSIEDIAENIQDVKQVQWSEKRVRMYEAAKTYYNTLQEINGHLTAEEHQKLKEELDLISKPFASEVAYIAFLEQERIAREAQIQKN